MNDFYVNAGGAAVTPALIDLVLMRSGMQWEMHPAQVFSLEMTALQNSTILEEEISGTWAERLKELGKKTQHTLMGIPVVTSMEYPKYLIRLMYNGEEVTRIENLAIPGGFYDYKDVESERRKMEAIGFRRTTQEK
jgi:hypothetical protein